MNGGLFKSSYELVCPKIQLIDIIKLPVKNSTIDKSFLHKKYISEGFSSKEIAALTFSSRSNVTRQLINFKIPLKKTTRKTTGPSVYGFRQYKGKSIELKKEQRIITQILSYRESGYSYQHIANTLNSSKIRTKLKRDNWSAKVVRQIEMRHRQR